MNQEALISTLVFWSAFGYSAGPFWSAIMEAARTTPISRIFRHYLLYVLTGWLSATITIGVVMTFIGRISPVVYTSLYFVGAGVMAYFAWKVICGMKGEGKGVMFDWKSMSLLTWTNPKVWLTVPPGFLSATYTDNAGLNILLFYLLGLPIFFSGFYLWAKLGQQGARFMKEKMSYFNAFLLASFALYLLYQGIQEVL